jgi:hypothetical protein
MVSSTIARCFGTQYSTSCFRYTISCDSSTVRTLGRPTASTYVRMWIFHSLMQIFSTRPVEIFHSTQVPTLFQTGVMGSEKLERNIDLKRKCDLSLSSHRARTGGLTFKGHLSNIANYLKSFSIILNLPRIYSELSETIESFITKLP